MRLSSTPRRALIVATLVPVLLAWLVVLVVYTPGLPGTPPRQIGRALLWVPPAAAIALLQLFPFNSWFLRSLSTLVFGGAMFYVLLMVYLFGACSHGDCI